MGRRSFVAAALLGALAVAAPASAAPAEGTTLDAATFSDAGGDSGLAPDITDVAVGNDVVSGPIVFWVTLQNRPDDLVGDDVLFILVDTDKNPGTGDEDGAEFVIGVDAENVWIDRWNGVDWVEAPGTTLTATYFKSQRSLRVAIHPDELGGTRDLAFYVLSASGEDADAAPNGAPAWSYALAPAGRPTLAVLGILVSPRAPVAGRRLAAAIVVARGDTLDFLTQGKVTCTLLVGGKPLKAARAGFSEGVPICLWNLPRTAKGKSLKGSIAVSYGGSTAKKSFSARAR